MATTHIQFDRSSQTGRDIKDILYAMRKLTEDGPALLTAMQHMIDGDGTDATHFTLMVTLGIFPTTADAKASWDELNSAIAKLTTDGQVSSVNAALKQAAAKHAIVG